jgi:hypothetical protein
MVGCVNSFVFVKHLVHVFIREPLRISYREGPIFFPVSDFHIPIVFIAIDAFGFSVCHCIGCPAVLVRANVTGGVWGISDRARGIVAGIKVITEAIDTVGRTHCGRRLPGGGARRDWLRGLGNGDGQVSQQATVVMAGIVLLGAAVPHAQTSVYSIIYIVSTSAMVDFIVLSDLGFLFRRCRIDCRREAQG